jgi:outer membrane lipoprotein carrier protein
MSLSAQWSSCARGFVTGVVLLAAATTSAAAAADVPSDDSVGRVQSYLGSLRTLQADFVQVVRNRQGQISSRATGRLSISRPDRFRWDYREPYVQTIVADGRKLWLYDSDLEQVTVRPLEAGLGSTPAMLLSGAGSVAESFAGGPVERDGQWTWCRLTPRERGSDFERVSLGFNARGELAAMQLLDKLGQTTELEFSELRRNVTLDAGLFRFEPPPGADVIGDAAS